MILYSDAKKKRRHDAIEKETRQKIQRRIIEDTMNGNRQLAESIHAAAQSLKIDDQKLLDYGEPELLRLLGQRPELVDAGVERQ
jgi:hypothetical protein